MEDISAQIDSVFDELSKTLIEKQFNSKLVNNRITRLKKFTKKADRVYFSYLKDCYDEFLNEEEKIYDEISDNLNEDEDVSQLIYRNVSEIEDLCEDTRKLVTQSKQLRNGIETINKRIKSYEKIQKLQKELGETYSKCFQLVCMEQQKDDIIVDED